MLPSNERKVMLAVTKVAGSCDELPLKAAKLSKIMTQNYSMKNKKQQLVL